MTLRGPEADEVCWETGSPRETEALGRWLGRLLRPGDLLALFGGLGAGKTVLVRGLVAGLGGSAAEVHSPSFTLVNEYAIPPAGAGEPDRRARGFAHVDLYRIGGPEELPGIGWDEYVTAAWIVAIEWAERAGAWLPADHLWIGLEDLGETRRRIRAPASGARARALLREWATLDGPAPGAGEPDRACGEGTANSG
jgi:tRNA threonylcarbamoyladenosine biosynthesis protein TsaE